MTSTATQFPDALAKRLHAIQQLITAGELKDAALKLNAEVKRTPNDPRIYLMGMRLAEAAGNPAGALEAARRAVKATPEWPVAVTELALLLARQNQFPEAMEMAERAVRLDGNNLEVLARVIDIAHRARNYDMAIVWLERAAVVNPDNIEIKRLLARDWRVTGQHDKAQAAYDQLVEALPDDREVLLGRAFNALDYQITCRRRCGIARPCWPAIPDDEEAQFYSEVARGNTPAKQPASMVRSLYDGFADHVRPAPRGRPQVQAAARGRHHHQRGSIPTASSMCWTWVAAPACWAPAWAASTAR